MTLDPCERHDGKYRTIVHNRSINDLATSKQCKVKPGKTSKLETNFASGKVHQWQR
jgi:hypothetical protein